MIAINENQFVESNVLVLVLVLSRALILCRHILFLAGIMNVREFLLFNC
jgi:hypothetical protein